MSFTHKYLGRQGPQLPADRVFLHENLIHATSVLLFSKESSVRGFENFCLCALLKRIKLF